MAKKSKILKNQKRIETVKRYAAKRAELNAIIRSSASSEEDKEEARAKIRKLPRDSSPTRIRNRCVISGRPRGVYSKFGLSRIALREKANQGELPGVTKASW